MDFYLGMIILFGGDFAINGWQLCQGQTLAIQQFTALFSILGTTYGGNGTTTFALPDLRGRVPIGQGTGPGLSTYVLGESGGTETISVLNSNLPSHSHAVAISVTVKASNQPATASIPAVGVSTIAAPGDPFSGDAINLFNGGAPTIALNTLATATGNTGVTGSNLPINVLQPYLVLNYQIAMVGVFPSRN
jgi:microcystin-dependent protein